MESESTVKRLIQDRNLWRKKHDDLADELDDKIIALEEKLKDKDASLAEASKIINDARARHRALEAQLKPGSSLEDAQRKGVVDSLRHELMLMSAKYDQLCREHLIQNDHLRNGRRKAEDQIAVLEDKLKDTVTLQFHDETVATATRRISILIIERDAFQRLAGDLQTEKSCMRADLENVCKELGVLKGEIEKWEEAHCAKNSDIDKLLTENIELKFKVEAFEAFFTGND